MTYDYDLFVIGGGSGGVRAARASANYGAKVAIAEEYRYGGTCVIRGCVPKKLFVYASSYRDNLNIAGSYGWTINDAQFDWSTLIANKDREIDRLNQIYINLLNKASVTMFDHRATLIGPHTLQVGDNTITAQRILVATGGTPNTLSFPGADLAITSNEAFHLEHFPNRVIVVGGGYIGIEFAQIFNGLGAQTTLVHRGEQVLRGFDEDVRTAVSSGLALHGVNLKLNTQIHKVTRPDSLHAEGSPQAEGSLQADGSPQAEGCGKLQVEFSDGSRDTADILMCATGRSPNTDIGLKELGVSLKPSGAIHVNPYSQTNIEHIYAVGDCTDRVTLTPVAIAEGQAFADTVFGGVQRKMNYDTIPSAVFSQPPAAVVGLAESEARKRYAKIDVYHSNFRPLRLTLAKTEQKTMMKLIVDAQTDRVLGAHMVGDDAAEIIQAVAIAMQAGATKAQFDATIALHPTTAEEFVLMRTKSNK